MSGWGLVNNWLMSGSWLGNHWLMSGPWWVNDWLLVGSWEGLFMICSWFVHNWLTINHSWTITTGVSSVQWVISHTIGEQPQTNSSWLHQSPMLNDWFLIEYFTNRDGRERFIRHLGPADKGFTSYDQVAFGWLLADGSVASLMKSVLLPWVSSGLGDHCQLLYPTTGNLIMVIMHPC